MTTGKHEIYPRRLIVSEIDGERIVYDLTEIGEPTLTASGSLKNVPLAPGINAKTGTPGSTRTAVSANPTPNSISKFGPNGNQAKLSPLSRFFGITYPGFSRNTHKHWSKKIFPLIQNRFGLSSGDSLTLEKHRSPQF